jgi:hypothetical protein
MIKFYLRETCTLSAGLVAMDRNPLGFRVLKCEVTDASSAYRPGSLKFICRGQIFCPMPRNLRAGHCLSV